MRVTVGIPFRNAERTLADAIRSVFAQTFDDWELLLVDDGSTDKSPEIAYSVADPRVKVISDGRPLGLSTRLNQIANWALGDYIARMDADDIMHPERLALQVRHLEENPNVDLVGTSTYTIDSESNPTGQRGLQPLEITPRIVLQYSWVVHPTVMGHARWFRANPYDGSYVRAEDHELWCRTCRTSKFAKLQTPLYFYRENGRDARAYLDDYLSSARTYRRIIRGYGPMIAGWPGVIKLILESWTKGAVYRIMTVAGKQNVLVGRRNTILTDAERESASSIIRTIIDAQVPGFEDESLIRAESFGG